MKFVHKSIVTASLLGCLALGALAQTATPPAGGEGRPHHGHHSFDPAKMQERVAKRLADLKQKLQITPVQESTWAAFANAMQPPANLQRPDREALAKLSTPERIDQMTALRRQRMAEMERRGEATKAFYNTLTAEQKKVFDAETARRRGGGHHMRG